MNATAEKLPNAIAPPPLRVAIVDDDPRFRRSLESLLQSLPSLNLHDSYSSGEAALASAQQTLSSRGRPPAWDALLTDIGLPGMDGIALTRQLKQMMPGLRVIVLTVFEDPHIVLNAICAGADGYLLKTAPAHALAEQFAATVRNGTPLSAPIAGTLLELVRASHAHRLPERVPTNLGLTPRQLEVLRGLVDGLTYREIGERLNISLDTVRSYIRQIYSALQVHNVAEAVTVALRKGLV